MLSLTRDRQQSALGRSVEIAKGSFLVIQFADGWLTALEKRDRSFWVA
jgi:hypothetical protein